MLDNPSRNNLNCIPIAGSTVIDWYNNTDVPEREKVRKIYQLY